MKKGFSVLLFLWIAATSTVSAQQNDAITRFFDKYVNDEKFTVVYVSPKMFQMVAKIETSDPEWNKFRDVVKDLGGLRVLVADSISNGMALYKEAMGRIPTSEYSELLTVRDGAENVRIMTRDAGDIINELLLLVGSPDEFVMLSFTGKIDLNKISTLAKSLDIEGVEHLEKVKKTPKND
jgi:hypothetical protein